MPGQAALRHRVRSLARQYLDFHESANRIFNFLNRMICGTVRPVAASFAILGAFLSSAAQAGTAPASVKPSTTQYNNASLGSTVCAQQLNDAIIDRARAGRTADAGALALDVIGLSAEQITAIDPTGVSEAVAISAQVLALTGTPAVDLGATLSPASPIGISSISFPSISIAGGTITIPSVPLFPGAQLLPGFAPAPALEASLDIPATTGAIAALDIVKQSIDLDEKAQDVPFCDQDFVGTVRVLNADLSQGAAGPGLDVSGKALFRGDVDIDQNLLLDGAGSSVRFENGISIIGGTSGQTAMAGTSSSIAIGGNSNAVGVNDLAVGTGATADGPGATALGAGASATAESAVAVGSGAQATMTGAIAIGGNARATNVMAVAIGQGAIASGSTAVGGGAVASGANAAAFGMFAMATGANSTALGENSAAGGTDSTALGESASAAQNNTIAIGRGVTTVRANQVLIGNAQNTYSAPGIASSASLASQGAAVGVVTSDEAGNLAVDRNLYNQVSGISQELQSIRSDVDTNRAGIAMAMALQTPWVPETKQYSLNFSTGFFQGKQAGALSLAARVNDIIQVNGGLAMGFDNRDLGGRIGVTVSW